MGNRTRSLYSHPSYRYAQLQNGDHQSAGFVHHPHDPGGIKTSKEINADILNITMHIADTFPELSKYIPEMPLQLSAKSCGEITLQQLCDYYQSLEAFVRNYATFHDPVNKLNEKTYAVMEDEKIN